jgi:hypothetical protein
LILHKQNLAGVYERQNEWYGRRVICLPWNAHIVLSIFIPCFDDHCYFCEGGVSGGAASNVTTIKRQSNVKRNMIVKQLYKANRQKDLTGCYKDRQLNPFCLASDAL